MSLARAWRAGRPLHVLIAVSIGVASGRYLFAEPLREHFEREKARGETEERRRQQLGGGGGGGGGE
jgi:hypothetical protein